MTAAIVIGNARQLTKEKKFDKAIELLESLFDTEYAESALFQCGKTMMHGGRDEEAKVYFDKLIAINPKKEEDIILWLIKFKSFNGGLSTAEEYASKLVAMNASNKEKALLALCKIYLQFKRRAKAEEKLNEVLKYDKNDSNVLLTIGKMLHKLGRDEEALTYFERVITKNTNYSNVALQEVMEIVPELSECYVGKSANAAEIKLILGKCRKYVNECSYDAAKECCNELSKMGLTNLAKENLSAIELFMKGDHYFSIGEIEKANECYRQIIPIKKYTAMAQDKLYKVAGYNKTLEKKIKNLENVKICQAKSFIKQFCSSILGNNFEVAYECCDGLYDLGYIMDANIGVKVIKLCKMALGYIESGEYQKAIELYNVLAFSDVYNKLACSLLISVNTISKAQIKNEKERENKILESNVIRFGDADEALKTLGKANLNLLMGSYNQALSYYLDVLESHYYIKEAIYGIFAIKLKTNRNANLQEFLAKYKRYFDEKEYYRLSSYFKLKQHESFRSKNDQKVIKHIVDRHTNDYINNLDVEKLYYQIIEQVKDTELLNSELSYYVKFDEPIGFVNGEAENYLKVVAFIDKTNIITMFPALPHINALELDIKVKSR